MNLAGIAAIIATAILALLIVFQIALICGAPFGKFAWGGSHRVLPKKLRLASISSIVLYIIFAVTALSKSGIAPIIPQSTTLDIITWIFAVYFTIGIVLNAVSRSRSERAVMTPVVTILAACFIIIALA